MTSSSGKGRRLTAPALSRCFGSLDDELKFRSVCVCIFSRAPLKQVIQPFFAVLEGRKKEKQASRVETRTRISICRNGLFASFSKNPRGCSSGGFSLHGYSGTNHLQPNRYNVRLRNPPLASMPLGFMLICLCDGSTCIFINWNAGCSSRRVAARSLIPLQCSLRNDSFFPPLSLSPSS